MQDTGVRQTGNIQLMVKDLFLSPCPVQESDPENRHYLSLNTFYANVPRAESLIQIRPQEGFKPYLRLTPAEILIRMGRVSVEDGFLCHVGYKFRIRFK